MIFKRFRRQQPKKPISAAVINDPLDAIEQALSITAAPPLEISVSAMGTIFSTGVLPPIWATIQTVSPTGNNYGPYAWYEALPQSGGTWGTGYQGGTYTMDPAYNTLNFLPILPIVVLLTRDAAGNQRFSAGAC
jgi:hypothetical protein